jgi:hypothetical protein
VKAYKIRDPHRACSRNIPSNFLELVTAHLIDVPALLIVCDRHKCCVNRSALRELNEAVVTGSTEKSDPDFVAILATVCRPEHCRVSVGTINNEATRAPPPDWVSVVRDEQLAITAS